MVFTAMSLTSRFVEHGYEAFMQPLGCSQYATPCNLQKALFNAGFTGLLQPPAMLYLLIPARFKTLSMVGRETENFLAKA